jgi:hypothetical protein
MDVVAKECERMRRTAAIVVVLLLVLCCVALAAGGLLYLGRPASATKPVVLISAPDEGEEVRVGEAVPIHAIARDSARVVRVEFWADGELQVAQNSSLPGGISPFPLATVWRPLSPGNHTINVRAFNAEDARSYASISLNAVGVADGDGDGLPDENDSCPTQAGFGTSAGCPDGDGDGVPDVDDACPEEAGVSEAGGCPEASEGDRDGDGILDETDACPDEPGSLLAGGCPDADGDGIADADDACPDEVGLPQHDGCPVPGDADGDGVSDEDDECQGEPGASELHGCPDLDGDGVADRDDRCPQQPGLAEHDGCPDTDGDGVADPDDLRPDEPGGAEHHGAPDTGAEDSDGDGLPDDVDLCDDEEGLPEHDGCPRPGEGEDLDGDGIPDEDEAPEGPMDPIPGFPVEPEPVVVEVEGLEFLLGQQYDEVACYIGVGDYYERYGPYELEGGTRWDIATDVGGENSVVVETPADEPLEVFMECEAYVGEEPPLSLGTYGQEHIREEWDGRTLQGRSEREEEPFGATFRVDYHICEGSCEESSLPAPSARLVSTWLNEQLVDTQIVWSWDGDEEAIDHFGVNYLCDNGLGARLVASPEERRISVHWVEPRCNETCEFYVAGYQMGGLVLTPRSNTVTWDGGECARGRTVTVAYDWFRPIPAVAGRGPIYGQFSANESVLSFDGAGEAYCGFYDEECGYYIHGGYSTSVEVGELFHDIRGLHSACESCSYEAPAFNVVSVPIPEGEDLTIGFEVWEYRHEGEDVLICSAQSTFEYDELRATDDYRFPSYDIEVPCRLQVSMHVWDWIGG